MRQTLETRPQAAPPQGSGNSTTHRAHLVAHMEDILARYQRPYDPRFPVVHMDAKPLQLSKETRQPLPAKPSKPLRSDYEDERVGTATVCLFTEPLTRWRTVDVREQRTGVDWAHQVQPLRKAHDPDAAKVRLVCDHLNTHKVASLSEACEPAEARSLAQRLEFHHTPKHGSWLHIAEIERSVLVSHVSTGASRTLRRYSMKPRRGSISATPNRLGWTGSAPPRMPAFGSNASTHNIKAEQVLVV